MRPVQAGDTLEVSVEKGIYRGLGLARHEGQVVFVPQGLPGERVRVRVESTGRGFIRAEPLAVLGVSPERRPSPCPYVPRCGGCVYQELSYPAQLALKESILRESLARAGAAWEGEIEIAGSPELAWRTRCSFHLEAGHRSLRLGLREEASHRVVDLERCLQLSDAMNRALRALRGGLAERPRLARGVRDVDVAESLDGSHLVVCLETRLAPREAAALVFLADRIPWLTGLGAVAGEGGRQRFLSLRGEPIVEARVAGVRLRSHVRSFFQANRFLVEPLVRAVVARTPPGGSVLDLYAGVGLFALALAPAAERVLGVELNPTAVEDATANAEAAGLANVRIRQGDVCAGLAAWRLESGERIVLDPPRTGAGAEVVHAVAARRPASVVYVSCDPPTLGRDLKLFATAGYRPVSVEAFDFFPDTYHLETLVLLLPA